MIERAPKSEVPKNVADLMEGNFLIPADSDLRKELRETLEEWERSPEMQLPKNERKMQVLVSRLAAVRAYNGEKK